MPVQGIPPCRKHGAPPYRVTLVHGGPGAPGTMGPLAQLLSPDISVLEPLQRAFTLHGLQRELTEVLEKEAEPPVVLVGHSWGAMLGCMIAALHPEHVRKLILVGSGVFDEAYADQIKSVRLERLSVSKRAKAHELMQWQVEQEQAPLQELSELFTEADAYDPLTLDTGLITVNARQHAAIWEEAHKLRTSGQLLDLTERIACEVVAIHGDYDPHPARGVELPLKDRVKNFRFILLDQCGHIPWIERHAKHPFLELLLREISS